MGFCNLISLGMLIIWKKEIILFLEKVIYNKEKRKEISLKFLKDSFTFKLIQISSTYFKIQNKKKKTQ